MKHKISDWLYGQLLSADSSTPPPEEQSGTGGPMSDWPVLAFRPLVIGALVTCIAAGWIMSVEFPWSGWRGDYLIPLVFVVSVEMLLVEQQLRVRRFDTMQRLQIRLAEMGVILLVLKPLTYLPRGWVALLVDSQAWLRQPGSFLDTDYVIGAMVMLLMWPLAMDIGGCLVAMQDPFSAQDREAGLSGLKERFLIGAFVLLLAVAAQRVDYSHIGLALHSGPPNAVTWLPLLYFGLGLLLLGQGRLALLQAAWEKDQVPVTPTLARRWAGWGVLFVGGVMLVSLFMPAGDTILGLFLLFWLLALFGWIGQIIMFVLYLLLALLLAPCLALFKMQQASPPVPPKFTLLQGPPPEIAGPAWLFYLKIAVFWMVVAVIAFLLLRIYWRERRALGGWGIWRGFVRLLQALWAWLLGIKDRVAIRLNRPTAGPIVELPRQEPGWWQFWLARSARERVRRFYLALLQRAAQAGHPRRPNQTPFEYATALRPHVTGEEDSLEALTGAFVEARYGRREFEPEEVNVLRRVWQRLQSVLKSK